MNGNPNVLRWTADDVPYVEFGNSGYVTFLGAKFGGGKPSVWWDVIRSGLQGREFVTEAEEALAS